MKASNLAALLFGFTASTLSEFVGLDFKILRGDLDRGRSNDQAQLVQRNVKRDGLALMTLSNQKTFYVATIKVGSNKDLVEVELDTGSSDLWVMGDNVNCTAKVFKRDEISNHDAFTGIFKREYYNCTAYGSFNPKNSKSYKNNHTSFYIAYRSLSYGTWGTDTVAFGDVSIPDFSFAVVNTTSATSGVLGLGLASDEVTNQKTSGGTQYENFPLRLKSEGIINKAAFSLYLSDQDTGSILFGAVDKAKYSGDLTTVPILNSSDLSIYGLNTTVLYTIVVHNMFLSDSGKNTTVSNIPQAASLDTGSTVSYFPRDVLDDLVGIVGGEYSTNDNVYFIPCYSSSNTTTFNINFGGTTVQIPISALATPFKATDKCYLGVLKQSAGRAITFGDNVLRSMYVVFDLDAQELSVAQAKYNNDTDIQVISSTVPGAVSATLYSSTSFSLWGTNTKHSSGVKVESGFMFFISLLAAILIP